MESEASDDQRRFQSSLLKGWGAALTSNPFPAMKQGLPVKESLRHHIMRQ